MDGFWANIGLMAIFLVIAYGYKRFLEYRDLKQAGLHEDEKIYRAAAAFVQGAPADEVKATLAGCFDFDKGDAEKILLQSIPHRTDRDGGRRAFIRSVNRVLGEEIYREDLSERCRSR